MSANKIRKRISKTIPRSSRCLNSIPPIEKRNILKVNNLTKYSRLEERERERLKQLMVVTCPVWWFFVDPATETGRTGRWKRRKASRSKNERLRGGEGRGEKKREEEEEEERWVSSGRKNTLAGPRQRSVRSFDVCGAHSHEDVRTIFYFEYLWASTCWCPTIPPPGLPGLPGVHNQRDSAEFSTPFFPHSLFPLVTRWISLSLYKDQDDLRNADSENRGEERIRAAFLSFSLVRCAGLAQISLKGSSTSQGLEWTMTVSLKEASSRR